MTSEARCEICGRPWDGGTLLPREIRCGGCHGEFEAFKALKDEKDARVHTDAQARQLAFNAHADREKALGFAQRRLWVERNSRGKDATSGAALPQTGAALQAIKDRATAKLAKLDSEGK